MERIEGVAPSTTLGAGVRPVASEAARAAKEFEAVMLSQSFGEMFKGVKSPSVTGGGHAEKVWQSLMVEELAKSVAEAGGVGVAASIMKEIGE